MSGHTFALQNQMAAGIGTQRISMSPRSSAFDRYMILVLMMGPTILQRFTLPVMGGKIPLCFVWFYGALALLLLFRKNIVVDTGRLIFLSIFACIGVASAFINRADASTFSFLFLILVMAPFALRIDMRREDYLELLKVYQGLALFIVVCGIVQFASQFVAGPDAMFPFDLVLPQKLFIQGYNLRIPVTEGAGIYKSTGLWLLEPSHFSQTCAFSLIIEAGFFRRPLRLAIFAAGVFLSFSGTGFILLASVGPLVVLRPRNIWLLGLVVIVAAVVAMAGDALMLSAFTDRLQTFSNTQSSAYARFISPFVNFAQMLREGGIHLVFGYGSGTMDDVTAATDFESHDTSWIKLVREYGIVGALGFMGFFAHALFRGTSSPTLALAFFVLFIFLGGYLLSPFMQVVICILGAWPRVVGDTWTEGPPSRSPNLKAVHG